MEDLKAIESLPEASEPTTLPKRRYSIWILLLLLLAFALRILLLDAQSIWWDEGISLNLAISSAAELFLDRLNNIHPPLYFLILKGWLLLVSVGAFTGRYLSVLVSWLQAAVLFAVAWRWFDRRTGTAALLLAAFSAVSVIYGQEIRVYAMLALIYLLLLAVTRELTRPVQEEGRPGIGLWLALGLLIWLGLHLHYIVLFVAAYVTVWALFAYIRQRCWADFRRWLLLLFLVLIASLPWFSAVWRNWTAVSGEAAAGTFVTEPAPLSFLLSQVWAFHLTGLAGVLARPWALQAAGAVIAALLILLVIRLGQKGTRRDTIELLAHWLIPLSSALIVWTVRSFSHPRYVSMFVPGLILLVAYITFPPKDQLGRRLLGIPKILAGFTFLAVLFSSMWGLWLYFVDPAVAKDDVRGAARYLELTAKSGDLILIPDTDWSFPFEYRGQAAVSMPGLDEPDRKWTNLAALTTGVSRVHMVDYENGTRDWQGLLPFALAKAGSVQSTIEFDGLILHTYALDERILEPDMQFQWVDYGSLALTGSWIEQDGHAGDGAALALRWELADSIEEDVRVSLRLKDKAGWPVAVEDALLIDEYGRPTHQWSSDSIVTTFHVLPIAPATPPFAYDLELQAYVSDGAQVTPLNIVDYLGAPQGQKTTIGSSHVAYRQDAQMRNQDNLSLSPWAEPIQAALGLTLLGAEVETGTPASGRPLNVQLLWQATGERQPDLQPVIALVQDDRDLAENDQAPVYGQYPISSWGNEEQVYERRILAIPSDVEGAAKVILRVEGEEYVLADLEIEQRLHSFDMPVTDYQVDARFGNLALLEGFNLSQTTIAQGETLPITLIWQALGSSPETDYVVFVHLLDENGRLVAQHDGPPAHGTLPSSGWLSGEYIEDAHEIAFLDRGYQGQGIIEVGLYDPASGERLLLSDGLDHVILPVQITVE